MDRDFTGRVTWRRATESDADAVMAVIEEARAFLKRSGVPQWQDGFPEKRDILADIRERIAFVYLLDGTVVGFDCLALGIEQPYVHPIRGAFSEAPNGYGVIHRTAVSDAARGKGVGHLLFSVCEEECRRRGVGQCRVDTHEQNAVMRHLAEREGYRQVAAVIIANGSERIVFEKDLK